MGEEEGAETSVVEGRDPGDGKGECVVCTKIPRSSSSTGGVLGGAEIDEESDKFPWS